MQGKHVTPSTRFQWSSKCTAASTSILSAPQMYMRARSLLFESFTIIVVVVVADSLEVQRKSAEQLLSCDLEQTLVHQSSCKVCTLIWIQ